MHGEMKGQVHPLQLRTEWRAGFILILVGFFPLWREGSLREKRDVWPS